MNKYILKPLEDESTGVICEFHIVSSINVDFLTKNVKVTIDSYPSISQYQSGKTNVGRLDIDIAEADVDLSTMENYILSVLTMADASALKDGRIGDLHASIDSNGNVPLIETEEIN